MNNARFSSNHFSRSLYSIIPLGAYHLMQDLLEATVPIKMCLTVVGLSIPSFGGYLRGRNFPGVHPDLPYYTLISILTISCVLCIALKMAMEYSDFEKMEMKLNSYQRKSDLRNNLTEKTARDERIESKKTKY